MAKAIIAGMAVSAIGIFSYVQLGVEPKIMWAGPNAVIGGLLFGFGIVLAGGCETGWMYRAVEGQVHYWWVGLGNVIGSTILAYYWDDVSPVLATNWDKVNLLKTFGPLGGLLVTYALLLFAFLLVVAQEKRFFRRATAKTETQENAARKRSCLIIVSIWWVNPCPYPAVATLEALPQLKKGEIPGSGERLPPVDQ